MSGDVTGAVARFIGTTGLEAMPRQVRAKAAQHVVDTIGVMVAGTSSDLALPLRRYLGTGDAPGASPAATARIVGWGDPAPEEVAALANATLGHALDYDDSNTAMRGHASVVAIAALLAAGTSPPRTTADTPLPGDKLLEAYVVGVEVATRIAQSMALDPASNPGWHVTGTVGPFASVAALARLGGFTEDRIRHALGLAASMASGLQRAFGTMTKPLHAGLAARNGVAAAALAEAGWTADRSILDGDAAFTVTYGGVHADPASIPPALGNPFVFEQSPLGMSIKLVPACYAVARATEAVLRITDHRPVDPADVRAVQCRVPPNGLRPLRFPTPATGLEGKFSMPYVLATGLLDGKVGLNAFTDEAVRRPQVADLLDRIVVEESAHCDRDPDGRASPGTMHGGVRGFVEVSITDAEGATRTERVWAALGGPQRVLTWDDLWEKFSDCTNAAGVDPQVASSVYERLTSLEQVDDVRALVGRLRARPSGGV